MLTRLSLASVSNTITGIFTILPLKYYLLDIGDRSGIRNSPIHCFQESHSDIYSYMLYNSTYHCNCYHTFLLPVTCIAWKKISEDKSTHG